MTSVALFVIALLVALWFGAPWWVVVSLALGAVLAVAVAE